MESLVASFLHMATGCDRGKPTEPVAQAVAQPVAQAAQPQKLAQILHADISPRYNLLGDREVERTSSFLFFPRMLLYIIGYQCTNIWKVEDWNDCHLLLEGVRLNDWSNSSGQKRRRLGIFVVFSRHCFCKDQNKWIFAASTRTNAAPVDHPSQSAKNAKASNSSFGANILFAAHQLSQNSIKLRVCNLSKILG